MVATIPMRRTKGEYRSASDRNRSISSRRASESWGGVPRSVRRDALATNNANSTRNVPEARRNVPRVTIGTRSGGLIEVHGSAATIAGWDDSTTLPKVPIDLGALSGLPSPYSPCLPFFPAAAPWGHLVPLNLKVQVGNLIESFSQPRPIGYLEPDGVSFDHLDGHERRRPEAALAGDPYASELPCGPVE